MLVAERMTPAAVDLALDIRKEIEAKQQEVDQLRCRATERAQLEADLAERRYMMVDPNNRLVADTLEADWNEKLRALSKAREEKERGQQEDRLAVDDAIRERLVTMTRDFRQLWADPATANRDRKRMLGHIIEDATLLKSPQDGYTKIHVRFRGGKTETLTTLNPKSSAEQIKTPPEIVGLVDRLLDDYTYSEIADQLKERGLRPGGSARPRCQDQPFCAKRVAYLAHTYGLRPRYDRLRERGMLTMKEIAVRLDIHEATVASWVKFGIIRRHAYNGHAYLYEDPGPNPPVKHYSRWDPLSGRPRAVQAAVNGVQDPHLQREEV